MVPGASPACIKCSLPATRRKSAPKGGNVLGMERYKDNFIMYQSYLSWFKAKDDELFINLGLMLTDGIQKFAESQGTDIDYFYLNYADEDQNSLAG